MSEDRKLQEPEALANTDLIRRLEQFVSFLCGASTFEDTSFGDKNPERRGGFWWRTPLRTLEKEIITALTTPPAPEAASVVPEGWKLVPVESTKEMNVAAVKFLNGPAVYKNVAAGALLIEEQTYGEVYEAMLAASPPLTAPAAPEAVGEWTQDALEDLYLEGWNDCVANDPCDAAKAVALHRRLAAPPQDAPAKAGTTPFMALDYIHNDEELEMYVQERIESATPLKQEGAEPVAWHPIETAPEGEIVVVFWREGEGEDSERYDFDHKEEGGWVRHLDNYDHYLMVGGPKLGPGPKEAAPYTHWRRLGTPEATAQEPAPQGDAERLDWLCEQYVVVRIPLRYGSKECFHGSPEDGDGETFPWDIRAAIDAARSGAKP